jgi:hypothetical protein
MFCSTSPPSSISLVVILILGDVNFKYIDKAPVAAPNSNRLPDEYLLIFSCIKVAKLNVPNKRKLHY